MNPSYKKDKLDLQYQVFQPDLPSLRGERWKDIPGLEGYYMISNYGRVKRLEYEQIYKNGSRNPKKSMIIKPTVIRSMNHFVNDYTYFVRTTISREGIIHNFSIARMVYYCFKARFDFLNNYLQVVCKNGNGKDIRLSNLQLVTMQERQKKLYAIKRTESVLLRQEVRFSANAASRKTRCRKISQYDERGHLLMTYPSVPFAAAAIGRSPAGISHVLKGTAITSGGYFWRYGTKKNISLKKALERKAAKDMRSGKCVTQYDKTGIKIAAYPSIMEAYRKTGIHHTKISEAVNGKRYRKSAGGFFWKGGEKE